MRAHSGVLAANLGSLDIGLAPLVNAVARLCSNA